jgi:peptidoglycan hydrolase-like protein with peptidoglycan-binding domain
MHSPDSPTRRGPWRYVAAAAVLAAVAGGILVFPAASAGFVTPDDPQPSASPAPSTPAPSTPAPSDAAQGSSPSGSAPGTAKPAAPPEPETLREGMRGPEVKALQERLAALHYDLGDRDGVFGPDTRHAVYAFQKVHGLQRDAVVGPRTRAALQSPTTPAPRHPRQGRYVEVDLERQVLLFFDGNQVTRIMSVSTGNHEPYETSSGGTAIATTPTGQFEVERKIDGMRVSDLGELWRPAYFRGGYAIHGSPSVPPYPASHGCVRVSMAGMDRIYDLLGEGTPVEVY